MNLRNYIKSYAHCLTYKINKFSPNIIHLRMRFTLVVLFVCTFFPSDLDAILNGKKVNLGDSPYVVSVQGLNRFNKTKHIGGGAIISPTVILTAAHLVKINGILSRVYAGIVDLNEIEKEAQKASIEKIVVHPEYRNSIANDIAVLLLATRLEFNKLVQPIQLPTPRQEFTGYVVVSGWGTTNKELHPRKLHFIRQLLDSSTNCRNAYSNHRELQFSKMVCVTSDDKSRTCNGDSGGALMQDNYVVGIVSLAQSNIICMRRLASSGTVFTKVSEYIDFINEYVTDNNI